MLKGKLVGLENLPDRMRVKLEDSFRIKLFNSAIVNLKKVKLLAGKLECHTDTILNLRNGKSFIKVKHLKKLSKFSGIPLKEIEKYIIELKTRNRERKIEIKLPIFATPELASLIGHCMGDGNLNERQFTFFNNRRELVDEVTKNVKISFSTNVEPVEFEKDNGWEIEFPTCIARLVAVAGGPIGKKVFLPFRVPKWIMNGDIKIKTAFVRALFDDEGWVKTKFIRQSSSTTRIIGIDMSKNEKFLKEHILFLEDIKKILSNLGVSSSRVTKMGKTKNGVSMGFVISNLSNLHKFLEIGFHQQIKQQKLIHSLDSSKRFHELFPNETL